MFVSKRKDNRKIKGRPGKPQGSVKAEISKKIKVFSQKYAVS